ncbi:MAG: hypothetical protein PHD29_03420 [bacterium]|nr:hypothetical protein [bacterium]MDD5354166.1 hypothetical protein [bacterium]MDD5756986.1 hypothetical protein [bacterium]
MTKKDILTLACKILGLYLLIILLFQIEGLLLSISSLFLTKGQRLEIYQSIIILVPFIIYTCLAIFLIKKSNIVANKLNLHDDKIITNINITKDELQESAYNIIGIVLIANAIIGIPKQAIRFGDRFTTVIYTGIIITLIQIVIGIYLVLGSKGLVKLITKLKDRKQ